MSEICPLPSLDELKNLMRLRVTCASDSFAANILAKFYPDNILATRDIQKNTVTYHEMARLTKKNYLEKIDDCHVAPRYKITFQGKCRTLCDKFGIRFLCLCIVAEAYAVRKLQLENGCSPSYSLFEMDRIFEGIYSIKTIRNSTTILVTKKLAYSKSCHMISLREEIIKDLDTHSEILDDLHTWIVGIPNYMNRLIIEDPHTYNEIRRIR